MALKMAVWVHGTAAQPGGTLTVLRDKAGAGFAGTGGGQIFIPIPSPVVIDGIRPLLGRVFVFYSTDPDVSIRRIEFMDGPRPLRTLENLNLLGDHSNSVDSANTFGTDPSRHLRVLFGLCLVLTVSFPESGKGPNFIRITSAGADFVEEEFPLGDSDPRL